MHLKTKHNINILKITTMAKTKLNIAYVGQSKTATEHQLHTLPSTLRSMVDVITSNTANDEERASAKKVLFGLLGISDESEVSNIVNLGNAVKAMRKACLAWYPYVQANDGESKIFLTRKGCYYSRQGSNDVPTKGFYFVENIDYNNIIHTSEKSRAKNTTQKVFSLNTLYTAKGLALPKEECDEETGSSKPIGYTLYSKCEDDKTGKTYYKKWKQQPFEAVTTTAEMLKLEDTQAKAKAAKDKAEKIKKAETEAKAKAKNAKQASENAGKTRETKAKK